MGWQPISTAPKDGTYILAVIRGRQPAVVSWQTHFGRSRWAEDPEIHGNEDCWEECFRFSIYEPTHWMPLPEPPEAAW